MGISSLKAVAKLFFNLFVCCIFCNSIKTQAQCTAIHDLQTEGHYDNIKVEPLHSDSLVSSFVIWIKNKVPAHKHVHHTEQVYVIEGSGKMTLASDTLFVHPGDWIVIPKNTVHSVLEVYGDLPLKVISVQAPLFTGKDRVPVPLSKPGVVRSSSKSKERKN